MTKNTCKIQQTSTKNLSPRPSWRALGGSWAALGGLLGASWRALGAILAHLSPKIQHKLEKCIRVPPLTPHVGIQNPQNISQKYIQNLSKIDQQSVPKALLEGSWRLLGGSWRALGGLLGGSWGYLGPSWLQDPQKEPPGKIDKPLLEESWAPKSIKIQHKST